MRGKLGPKAERLVVALLAHDTHDEACAAAGVSPATGYRWLKDPAFLAEYGRARRRLVQGTVARLQRAALKAVASLERNLECGNRPAEVRAAEVLLDTAFRGLEVGDLAAQLEALEQRLAGGNGDGDDGDPGAPGAEAGGAGPEADAGAEGGPAAGPAEAGPRRGAEPGGVETGRMAAPGPGGHRPVVDDGVEPLFPGGW
jgi:hypothetical protein